MAARQLLPATGSVPSPGRDRAIGSDADVVLLELRRRKIVRANFTRPHWRPGAIVTTPAPPQA
jgi:hypothetical protein